MKTKFLVIAPIVAISLSACSLNGKKYDPSDYILSLPINFIGEKQDFRILQLTDTHIGDKDDFKLHSKFMDLTINDANADMIIVTGDLFTFASKSTALEFFNWLDSKGLPWTVTFGNHDEQCYFSVDWMTSVLNNYGSNCLFKDIQDDNVHGNANFAINLMLGDIIFHQLIIMDSNRYYYGDYFGYDCFKKNQIEWYENLVKYTAKQYTGYEDIPADSFMFYHIPLPEINEAYEIALANGAVEGTKNEKTCPPDKDFHFFDTIQGLGSTKAMFFGHDHINDFRVNYMGVDFCYGLKSTDRIYYDDGMLGGQVISLHSNHTYTIEQIHHTYKEVK